MMNKPREKIKRGSIRRQITIFHNEVSNQIESMDSNTKLFIEKMNQMNYF